MLDDIKLQRNYKIVFSLTRNVHKHTILLPKLQHQITRVSDLNWYCPRAHTHAEHGFQHTHTQCSPGGTQTNSCRLRRKHRFSLPVPGMHINPVNKKAHSYTTTQTKQVWTRALPSCIYTPVRAQLCFSVLCTCFSLESLLDQ